MNTQGNLVRPAFLCMLRSKLEGDIIGVEVGADKGENAAAMLNYCNRLHLELIDIVDKPGMREAIEPYKDRVNFINKPSVEAAKLFEDGHFDFIYIDGAHDYKSVLEDITVWWSKIKKGGIFSGHDWWYAGVKQSVVKFFDPKLQLIFAVAPWSDEKVLSSQDAEIMDWWTRVA